MLIYTGLKKNCAKKEVPEYTVYMLETVKGNYEAGEEFTVHYHLNRKVVVEELNRQGVEF